MATTQANQAIYDRLNGMQQFHPGNVTLLTDWSIEPGDVIQVQSGTDANGDAVFSPMPVYQLDMTWRGAVTAEVQATGNEKRPPLSALRRQNYSYGHGISQAQKTANEAVNEVVYISDFTKTDRGIGMLAQAIGVKIDEDTGLPAKDEHGEYLFDGVNGATLTGTLSVQAGNVIAEVQQARGNSQTLGSALSLKADTATLISAINNASGTIASGKVQVQPGNVLIEAINGADGTVTINAGKINLQGYVTATDLSAGTITAISAGSGSVTAGSIVATDATLTNITSVGDTTIDALYLGNSGGTANWLVTADNLVKSLAITPPASGSNDYTLTWTTADGVPHTLTFSRAAQVSNVSGTWNGSTLTVAADPNSASASYVTNISAGVKLSGTVPAGTGTITLGYNSTDHKYYIRGQAFADGTEVAGINTTTGTEAYTAGRTQAVTDATLSVDTPYKLGSVIKIYPRVTFDAETEKSANPMDAQLPALATNNSGTPTAAPSALVAGSIVYPYVQIGTENFFGSAYTVPSGTTVNVESSHPHTMTANSQTVTPSSGYDAMAQVVVDASGRYYAGKAAVVLSDTLSWATTPSSSITANQNTVTISTSGRTDTSGTADEREKTINLYSNASTSGLTATFYVTHTNSLDANRIIKRTATCSDSNLTAANIKSGVSIFGVTGTYTGSGGSTVNSVKLYTSADGSEEVYSPYTYRSSMTVYPIAHTSSGDVVGNGYTLIPDTSAATLGHGYFTANGTYSATDDGYNGYSTVEVSVPNTATLGSKTFTANGTYRPSSYGLDGFSAVTVNVPSSSTASVSTVKKCTTTELTAAMSQSSYKGSFSVTGSGSCIIVTLSNGDIYGGY